MLFHFIVSARRSWEELNAIIAKFVQLLKLYYDYCEKKWAALHRCCFLGNSDARASSNDDSGVRGIHLTSKIEKVSPHQPDILRLKGDGWVFNPTAPISLYLGMPLSEIEQ